MNLSTPRIPAPFLLLACTGALAALGGCAADRVAGADARRPPAAVAAAQQGGTPTGSRIPRADGDAASTQPVTSVSGEDLRNTGRPQVSDALRTLVPAVR